MDKYKKLANNTIIFAIGTFSSKVLSFLLMPFVTRVMKTGDYGAADLIQQTVNVLIPIVFLQVNSACLRFAMDKTSDKSDVFSIGVKTTLKGFVVFLLFAYPISLIKINDFYFGDYIILIYAFVLVSGFRQLCQQFVRGCGNVKTFSIDGIIATTTYLMFTLLFLGVFKWGINGYVGAIILSDACSVLFFFLTQKLWKYIKINGTPRATKHDMLKYCIPMMPMVILWWIVNVSDRYMVTYFVDSSANGLYTAASKIPNFVIMFSSIFMDAWQLSAVSEYDSKSKSKFFTNVFNVYSSGIFVVSSGLILFCQIITKILVAESYYSSWQFAPVLLVATSISCMVNFMSSVYMAEKKNIMAMVTALCSAVVNAALNIILIPNYGAIGAAISTVISFVIAFIIQQCNTKKYIKIDFKVPALLSKIILLIFQCIIMLYYKSGIKMYIFEIILFMIMLIINLKPLTDLLKLLINRFVRKENAR